MKAAEDVIQEKFFRLLLRMLWRSSSCASSSTLAQVSAPVHSAPGLTTPQVLENLVAGEIMQLTATVEEASSMDHYLRKTFCKTASLMANSCKSVAVLAGAGQAEAAAAWEYGQHLGMAFQLVDDILDFTGTAEEMGKPAGSDLRAGLATAPVLLAAEQQPELGELVQRRFKGEGDVERALQLVEASDGMQRARALAAQHAGEAAAALARLPLAQSAAAEESLRALGEITQRVLTRRK